MKKPNYTWTKDGLFLDGKQVLVIMPANCSKRFVQECGRMLAEKLNDNIRCGCHMDPGTYCNQYDKGRCKYVENHLDNRGEGIQ